MDNILDKKHVSIIGTCVSREVFNDPRLEDVFAIDFYAFKVCPFAICSEEGLGIPLEKLSKANLPEFIIRNLNYDFNKNLLNLLKEKNSEYIVIDLTSLVNDSIFKVTYNQKSIYVQTHEGYHSLVKIRSILGNSFTFEKVTIDKLDKHIIEDGLGQFANWLNNFGKKIVVFWPVLSKKYFGFDYKVKSYSEKSLKLFEEKQKNIDMLTEMFTKKLNKPNIIKWSEDTTGKNINTDYVDFLNKNHEPNPVHITNDGYLDIATRLLAKLRLNYKKYYTKGLDYETYKYEYSNNMRSQLINFQERSYNEILCSLNAYTNYLLSLKHHLIIFSVQADCQGRIKYWRNRKALGLNFYAHFRDSFIGVIDTKNNFKYEKFSQDALTYTYNIPNTSESVFVESHGFYATNFSSIKYRDKEYSKGKRGFNILVIDLNTMEVEDVANCDTCLDDYLIVDSDKLSVFNVKK